MLRNATRFSTSVMLDTESIMVVVGFVLFMLGIVMCIYVTTPEPLTPAQRHALYTASGSRVPDSVPAVYMPFGTADWTDAVDGSRVRLTITRMGYIAGRHERRGAVESGAAEYATRRIAFALAGESVYACFTSYWIDGIYRVVIYAPAARVEWMYDYTHGLRLHDIVS